MIYHIKFQKILNDIKRLAEDTAVKLEKKYYEYI